MSWHAVTLRFRAAMALAVSGGGVELGVAGVPEVPVAPMPLAEAGAGIAQARANLKQADDEYETRAELFRRNSNAVSEREVETAQTRVEAQKAALAASEASRAGDRPGCGDCCERIR